MMTSTASGTSILLIHSMPVRTVIHLRTFI
jgi:hypothetical protein